MVVNYRRRASSQLLLAQLRQGNLTINFTAFHQLVVGSFSDDTSLIKNDDLFGILDGGNALGHDEQGAVTGVFFQCPPQG